MLYQRCISGILRVKEKFIEVANLKHTLSEVSWLYDSRRTAPQPNLPDVNIMMSTMPVTS